MKNVLVLLHDDEGQEARLQVALDLARALSGHLMLLDAIVPPAVVSDYISVAGGAMMMECERERERHNRSLVAARMEREDVPWSMIEKVGAAGRELRNASDLADVIVVSLPTAETAGQFRHIVGDIAVRSSRPVLAVPAGCRGFDVTGHALVCWNASHEASEALREAIPLLQHAGSVTLLDVDHPAEEFSVHEAAAYLSRHGIHAEIVKRQSAGNPISDIILNEAHATAAAYVVIGAYGTPRAIEFLFGGVTAGLLRKSDLPVFLTR